MAIKVIENSESQNYGPVEGRPILIDSSASRTLVHELRRYCNKQVSGRSFLIAGHRGSGKTTIMLNAFGELLQESYNGKLELRPLLVLLQGPNLLLNPEDAAIGESRAMAADAAFKRSEGQSDNDAKDGAGIPEVQPNSAGVAIETQQSGNGSGTKTETADPEMENVLKQIILGLYRALSDEISREFRRKMCERASILSTLNGLRKDEIYNELELAAELELELDEYPGKMRLREFWDRANVLREGVLFRRPDFPIRPLDQGLRELVALCTACEAYRRISGMIKTQQQIKSGTQAKEERQVKSESSGKDLLAPLIPLLCGGAAAAGALVINPSAHIGAVLAGFVSALATAVTLKYSASWSRERSAAREDFFIPDLSVATLDRVLPVLISRIRDAGLAPVFVVDELDKVRNLSVRITDMVQRLKKLVAENSYFCFLTDRNYFEEVRQRGLKNPYSIEYTYYSDQLFVTFGHQELHEFLSRILKVQNSEPLAATAAITSETAAKETLQTIEVEKVKSDEEADATVLPFILLQWSKMHAIDLRRRLGAIRDVEGNVNLSRGAVRTQPYYRLQLTIQVAIEILLEDPKMESELEDEPSFRRLAHDALYYISRKWDSAPTELNLDDTPETIDTFEKYLSDCMAADPPPSAAGGLAPMPPTIGRARLDLLLGFVRELASLLASPKELEVRANEKAKSGKLHQRVLQALSDKPLLRSANGKAVYLWCFYRSGRDVIEGQTAEKAPEAVPAAEMWKTEADFILALKDAVANLAPSSIDFVALSSKYGVIPTSPAWANIEYALERLKNAEKTSQPYSEQETDVRVVGEFSTLLKANGQIIALALTCGGAIGCFSRLDPPHHILFGLKVISDAFRFLQVGVEEVDRILIDLYSQLQRHSTGQGEIETLPQLHSQESIIGWREWLVEAAKRLDTPSAERLKVIRDSQLVSWNDWFERFQDPSAKWIPKLADLICAAAAVAPAKLLKFDIGSMNLRDWSRAFHQCAAARKPASEANDPPGWFALAALDRLGFAVEDQSRGRLLELLGRRSPDQREMEQVMRWKPIDSPARRNFSVLICVLEVPKTVPKTILYSPSEWIGKRPRPASQWPLSTRCAGMVLGLQEITDLRGPETPDSDDIFRFLGINQLAFEVAAPGRARFGDWEKYEQPFFFRIPIVGKTRGLSVYPEIEDFVKFAGFTASEVALIVPERRADWPFPYVIAPQNLDEFSERLEAQP